MKYILLGDPNHDYNVSANKSNHSLLNSKMKYQLVYQDQFDLEPYGPELRERFGKRFGLSSHQLRLVSSGAPVVIKKSVALGEAERYQHEIRRIGGTCWIQEASPDGRFVERRGPITCRRILRDRRVKYRPSSSIPDRRQSCGQRTTDHKPRYI